MSEDPVRCSKCNGAVTNGVCSQCGMVGQPIACEHCGAECPSDAKWCPTCGKSLSQAKEQSQASTESTAPAGASILRLVLLLCVIGILCYLILRPEGGVLFAPLSPGFFGLPISFEPLPLSGLGVVGALAAAFALPTAPLRTRLRRAVPVLMGGALATAFSWVFSGNRPPRPRPVAPVPATISPADLNGDTAHPGVHPYVDGALLVRFTDSGADRQRVEVALSAARLSLHPGALATPRPAFREILDADTGDVEVRFDRSIPVESAVAALRRDPRVVFAVPDYILQAEHTPNDPYFDQPYESRYGVISQWYLKAIHAPEAWDTLKPIHSEIRLAIIDTGVDFKHPDLADRIARDSKGGMVGRNMLSSRKSPLDDNGHGTHCAGIASASTDNQTGVAGVAFNTVKIVPVKVMTRRGMGELGWIVRGITWAADHGCRVESLSLGMSMYIQPIQDAVNYAWSKGAILVAAAGNSGVSEPGYPAGCNHVLGVSATDETDRRAVFSNFGVPVGIGAPGVKILATMPSYPCELSRNYGFKENYDALNGTSMACPVVAGALAALLAYQPTLTPEEALERLQQTADNTPGTRGGGWDPELGFGRVNLNNLISNRRRDATSGCFYGQVVNKRGKSLSGVVVTCEGVTVETQQDGMFRLSNIKEGEHSITASRDGLELSVTSSIVPGADRQLTLTFPPGQ